jgi:rSAM/selenodomain-associated transferase 2/rSAM/selenodomain-associated transferase 1
MMDRRLLIFFVKSPEPGAVKTRLSAEIGRDLAVELYKDIGVRSLKAVEGGDYEIRIDFHPPDRLANVKTWLGEGRVYFPQEGADLGQRMENAFKSAFSSGFTCVVLTGSDIPDLSGRIIEEAFSMLTDNGAVIGPAKDGGYYLIGFTQSGFLPEVFNGIRWGTDTVFIDTMAAFKRAGGAGGAGVAGAQPHILPELTDIDRAEDILRAGLSVRKKFSVIIPVLHEAVNINRVIRHLRKIDGSERLEIIVVDGSPRMDTLEVVEDAGAIKLTSGKGRARQMNKGAAAACGEVLIFLHADTLIPENAFSKIEEVMSSGRYKGGAFDLSIDSNRPFMKFVTWSAGIRSRITRVPYGDQAIFIRKDYFNEIGGYKDMPLMEDVELMKRVRKRGGRICILKERAQTSARKYITDGIYFSAVRNHVLRILYALGVKPETLAKIYYRR